MNYIKPLDSLRAIAVILVIVSHWLHFKYIEVFALGYVGVNIFFVLSGFLITKILLENKKDAEKNDGNKFHLLKNFIIRRTLRIFPIYYLTIFIVFLLGENSGTSIRENIGYYVTYSSNILFFINQGWEGKLSHLWSLAVEEQFYLIWPWVIIFIHRRYLFAAIISFFFLGLFSYNIFSYFFPNHPLISVLTPTCFDAFSAGAIFSYLLVYRPTYINVFSRVIPYLAIISILAFIFSSLYKFDLWIPHRTFISIGALYLVSFTVQNSGSILHKLVLNNKGLIFMGKISYGIYLYHNFMPALWKSFIDKLNEYSIQVPLVNAYIPKAITGELMLVEKFVALLLLSWLSWTFIEYPINKLKDRFNYKKVAKEPVPQVSFQVKPIPANEPVSINR